MEEKKIVSIKKRTLSLLLVAVFILGFAFNMVPLGFHYKTKSIGNSSFHIKNFNESVDGSDYFLRNGNIFYTYYGNLYSSGWVRNVDEALFSLDRQNSIISAVSMFNNADKKYNLTREDLYLIRKMNDGIREVLYEIKYTIPAVDGKYDKEALLAHNKVQLIRDLTIALYSIFLYTKEELDEKGIEERYKEQREFLRSDEFKEKYLNPLLAK